MPKRVVEVRKWGNSKALVIPADILAQLKWQVKDLLIVGVERGALTFRPLQLPMPGANAGVTDAVTNGDAAK